MVVIVLTHSYSNAFPAMEERGSRFEECVYFHMDVYRVTGYCDGEDKRRSLRIKRHTFEADTQVLKVTLCKS